MNVASGQYRLSLLDLPNEILLIIIEYISVIDVLYSLVGITERLDQLVLDPISVRTLKLTCLRLELLPERIYALDERAFATLCRTVLPRIRHPINELIVDQFAIDDIFRAREYPQLHSLSLVNLDESYALDLTRGDGVLCKLLKEQITSLTIDLNGNCTDEWSTTNSSALFHSILQSCPRLTKFHFCASDHNLKCRRVEFSSLRCQSDRLTDLRVITTSFRECLYLFDGHFPSLQAVTIFVDQIGATQWERENVKPLHKLQRFSLISFPRTYFYDALIVPFLRRMVNLEELSLYLAVSRRQSDYINGVQLRDDILRYMPRMKKFHFSIDTAIMRFRCRNLVLSSNVDIQRSFIEGQLGSVGSYVDVFAKKSGFLAHQFSLQRDFYSRCHIYSLPYRFARLAFASHSLPAGIFQRIRVLSVTDVRSFEPEFFRTISHSFPALQNFCIFNKMPQERTPQAAEAITFPRLRILDLSEAHMDYAVQFLTAEHCHLPRLQVLKISWSSVMAVTHDCTNIPTRFTCSRLKFLEIREPFVRSACFHDYFSSL